jgi:uncharacterized protein involved in outer membrane biogenesis
MTRLIKWALALLAALFVLALLAAAALWHWAGSDDFRLRAEQEATRALGLPVRLGKVELAFGPPPAVALEGLRVESQPPITLARIEARPHWPSLLRGRPVLQTLVVRDAVLPQQAITVLAAALKKQEQAAAAPTPDPAVASSPPAWPKRVLLDRVTWKDDQGRPMTLEADIALGDNGLPDLATAQVVAGRFAGARARLEREGDTWKLLAHIGGGTVGGPLKLTTTRGGWKLQGDLATDKVEVAALTAPSRTLTGKLEARTTLSSEFREPGALADAMRTSTRFTVRQAVVHGVDLAQAVRTVGTSRGGQTALDTLTGQVTTQGRAVQLSNLVASSGLLAATGNVGLTPERNLSGRVSVELGGSGIGRLLGVPLAVGGTLDAPTVTLAPGALLGGGTGAAGGSGAGGSTLGRVGEGLRGLFGK